MTPAANQSAMISRRGKRFVRTWWSDQERAEILAILRANGGDVRATMRMTGVPDATIRAWKNGTRHPGAMAPKRRPRAWTWTPPRG